MKRIAPGQHESASTQETDRRRATIQPAALAASTLALVTLVACTGGSGNADPSYTTPHTISQPPKSSPTQAFEVSCDPPLLELGAINHNRRTIGISLANFSSTLPASWYRRAIYRIFTADNDGNLTPFATTAAGIAQTDEIDNLPAHTQYVVQAGVFVADQSPSSIPNREQLADMAATMYPCGNTSKITS